MAKITLSAATWVCVNPGAAYASGVEIMINVGKTTANLRYELKNSDTVAPNQIEDITEAVQTLSVKAVDGKGFLWLISQGEKTEVQVETISPSVSVVSVPEGLAKDASVQATNEILAAIENPVSETLISGTKWAKYVVDTAFSGLSVGDITFKVVDAVDGTTVWHDVDHNIIAAPTSEDFVLQMTGLKLVAAEWQRNYNGTLQTKSPLFSTNLEDFGTVLISGEWA